MRYVICRQYAHDGCTSGVTVTVLESMAIGFTELDPQQFQDLRTR